MIITQKKPFFILAPMDDVTDTVFRRVVASCAVPDLFFTEFVNVDGLQSPGRQALLPKLALIDEPYPVIAQVWGKNPDNFKKCADEIVDMGFAGIDINFGCPVKNVTQNGTCSAFILSENRDRAVEIIKAVQDGAADRIPVSVKTRLGFNEVDLTWHTTLLELKLNMLTIHARTKKEMSKVPAHWDLLPQIVAIRNKVSPDTKIVGNGDVMTRKQGLALAHQFGVDGIMIGRGIFADPFCFAEVSPWTDMSREEKIQLYRKHLELFIETWGDKHKFEPLKKFAKIYLHGFEGASELRDKVVRSNNPEEMLAALSASTELVAVN